MQFLRPEMLWGLLALSVPIAVHLFNFRKQRIVYFPFTSFLKEIKEETQQQSKIKHWIILLLRMLAIALIVLAFAQPTWNNTAAAGGKKNVSIYIDNSFSMENQKDGISLLDNAKNKALDIVFAHGENDNYQILANEFSGIQQHFVTKDKALEIIQSIQPSSISRKLNEVIERQQDLISKKSDYPSAVYHISDFQKTHLNPFNPAVHTKLPIRWIPVQNESSDNVYIDSVYFEIPYHSPSQEEILHVVLKNAGENPVQNIRCEFSINHQIKGVTTEQLMGLEKKEVLFPFTSNGSGIQECKINLNDQPIVFDNNFYFTYWIEKERPIGLITEQSAASQRVFQNDAHYPISVQQANNANLNGIINSPILILENLSQPASGWIGSIKQKVEDGGTLIMVPPVQNHNPAWNNVYTQLEIGQGFSYSKQAIKGDHIDFNHPLFKGVFSKSDQFQLPQTSGFLTGKWSDDIRGLIFYPDGSPMLWTKKMGKGQIFGWNFNTTESSVFQHSIFPIAMLRCAELSGNQQPLFFTIGQSAPFVIQNLSLGNDDQITLQLENTNEKILPLVKSTNRQVSMSIGQYINKSGIYRAMQDNAAFYSIGINYDKEESALQFMNESDLKNWINENAWTNIEVIDGAVENVGNYVKKLDQGNEWWWYFIILSLCCLLTESLLTGIWKM
ncbi:MAG: hypothetical protein RLY35_1985 [Bacteroidota bacterium]